LWEEVTIILKSIQKKKSKRLLIKNSNQL